MTLRIPLLATSMLACSAFVRAQEAPAPTLHEGDRWIYQLKTERPPNGSAIRRWENTVQRVGSGNMVVANKPVDSNLPPTEVVFQNDWSRMASLNGKMTTTVKNFDFPLQVGKTWQTAATQDRPEPKILFVRNTTHAKVIGWEDVTVPAGTFRALKIEVNGDYYQEFERTDATASSTVQAGAAGSTTIVRTQGPTAPEPVAGRFYRMFWYAPDVKREVKSLVETINPSGTLRERQTAELESFKVQP